MLCQSCGKKQANTHIKRIINGQLTEYMLCEECAAKLGYSDIFSGDFFNLDNFLDGFFENSRPRTQNVDTKRCDVCGSSFSDILNSGKVGCAHCYDVFIDQLMPSIKRIHGNTKHSGKYAALAGEETVLKNRILNLKERMKTAIDEQNFEEAAKIRDEIKNLESKGNSEDE